MKTPGKPNWEPRILESISSISSPDPGRRGKYDGEDEYNVEVREKGNHKNEHANSEQTVERTQDTPSFFHVSPRVMVIK